MNKDKASLFDIADSMRRAVEYIGDASAEAFDKDDITVDAVIRRIEIIGEATKRLSPDLRDAHPSIPWKEMAGMRDRVIHGYDVVDVDIVHKTVTEEFPTLLPQIESILTSLPDPLA